MKTFKQHLVTEAIANTVWGKHKTIEYVMNYNSPFIPLDTKLWKRLRGMNERVIAFHITSIEGLKRLVSIQNTQKSISTTSKVNIYHPFEGIETVGGIVVKVEGNHIISGERDIFSQPDEQGRRWITPVNFMNATMIKNNDYAQILYKNISREIDNLKIKFAKEFLNSPEFKASGKEMPDSAYLIKFVMEILSKPVVNDPKLEAFRKKFSSYAIRKYMGEINAIVFKKLSEIQKYIDKTPVELELADRLDEHVINQIKILEVMTFVDGVRRRFDLIKELKSIVGSSVKVDYVETRKFTEGEEDEDGFSGYSADELSLADLNNANQNKLIKFISHRK